MINWLDNKLYWVLAIKKQYPIDLLKSLPYIMKDDYLEMELKVIEQGMRLWLSYTGVVRIEVRVGEAWFPVVEIGY